MLKARLGRTGLTVNKDGFGVLPLQRTAKNDAVRILRKALDGGINFFDSARAYSDSEEKIGAAFEKRRGEFVLATKTKAGTADGFYKDLETSLAFLKTDYIDIYQFHNPSVLPRPGDGSGCYEAMLKARDQGKIRFIGVTNHRLSVAKEAVESGLYDTLQFPFNYLSAKEEEDLAGLAAEHNMGFIAMKGLSGGLITDIAAARAYLAAWPFAVPIWGIQRENELEELLRVMEEPALLSEEQKRRIESDRAELRGGFCRACGYCMPCPVGIEINTCARMSLLLRRMPPAPFLGEKWQKEMAKIDGCLHCLRCAARCPYGLDTPSLLEKNYQDYKKMLSI
ncbi:MAG: aldo/keto reductase [Spirochaetaceae bacterium]|jgi:aryl-alcohol dehydrogenase-like predicted oxidoreductase|nr:aldo/keto reductase [Spirochaetaceae bacterium]